MLEKIEQLLQIIYSEVKNEREKKILKGENFNLFSILGIEYSENQTHSAFIGELLNPKGSHSQGSLFLKFFLEEIFEKPEDILDISTSRITLEKSIGKVDLKQKKGGRIDIYIEDELGRSISIENKINAEEQQFQITRYFNFQKGKNTVVYLTKFGQESKTAEKLIPNHDYFPISYSETIINWLIRCQMASSDFPILRETIKQYSILIKKITYTMNTEFNDRLQDLILSNLEAAEMITRQTASLKKKALELLQNGVFKILKEELSEKFNIQMGPKVPANTSSIWVRPKDWKNPQIYFGIEGFSGTGHTGNKLFFGIANGGYLAEKYNWDRFKNFWAEVSKINSVEIGGNLLEFDLSDGQTLLILIKNNEESRSYYKSVALQFIEFITKYENDILKVNAKLKEAS